MKTDTTSSTRGILSRLMHYAENEKKWMVLSWVLSGASGIASLGPYVCIYLMAQALMQSQDAFTSLSPDELGKYGWLAVQAVGLSFMLYGMALFFSHLAAFRIIGRLRVRLIRHLMTLPLGFHIAHPSGKLRKTIEKGCDNTENFVAHQLPDTIQAAVVPIAFLLCMIWFDWILCLVCLTPIVTGFVVLQRILKSYRGDFLVQYQNAQADMSAGAVEYVRGISVVKVFSQSLHVFTRFHEAILNYKTFITAYVLSVEKWMAFYISTINGIFFLLIPAGILLYCIYSEPVANGRFVASFIFFVVFIPLVPLMLSKIMLSSSNKLLSSQALDSIEEILEFPTLPHPASPVTPTLPQGHAIKFTGVNFAYSKETPKILDNVSFLAEQGGITALVGPSGGGKTTIINLIARFWDVDAGSITVGGVDVRNMDYGHFMSQVGLVSQEPKLFAMSIADNVAFCTREATPEQIAHALAQAQCDDIIAKFTKGMHTMVGAGGVHLSYGEMQRICLARAILQDPAILLLDEIMAFADPDNEYRIQQSLNILMRNKTVIMVAHRLSTIKSVKKILVVKGGRIVESGDHQTLIENGGLYSKMYNEYQTACSWKLGGSHA